MNLYVFTAAIISLLLLSFCRQQESPKAVRLPQYYVTNWVVAKELREVIQVTNGLSLYFTDSKVVVWFTNGSSVILTFAPETLTLKTTVLSVPGSERRPAQNVADFNADGVPEARRLMDNSAVEVFYRGEWFPVEGELNGKGTVVTNDGKRVLLRFDRRRWVEKAVLSDGQDPLDLTNLNLGGDPKAATKK